MSIALVIGANRGIGLEICRQLSARGDDVIGACRTASTELRALKLEVIEGVDVTSDAAVSDLAKALTGRPVETVWVVAGVLRRVHLDDLDFDEMRAQYETNALGPLRVVAGLMHLLAPGAKVALLTSRMGSIADNTSGAHYAYRMSKAALNMAGHSLAIDLAPRGISVALLHPGWVRTDMTGGSGLIDADESAAGLIARVDELNLANSGGFWHQQGERLPW